jgi:hypothetical protein
MVFQKHCISRILTAMVWSYTGTNQWNFGQPMMTGSVTMYTRALDLNSLLTELTTKNLTTKDAKDFTKGTKEEIQT